MALAQRLDFRQNQSLVMTPQLQQSIKLLQLPTLDILPLISEELQSNPFLISLEEYEEFSDADLTSDHELKNEPTDLLSIEKIISHEPEDIPLSPIASQEKIWEADTSSTEIFEELIQKNAHQYDNTNTSYGDSEPPETRANISLHEHIIGQIHCLKFSGSQDRAIAIALLNALNEKGWLEESTANIATLLNTEEENVLRVLEQLQQLEPTGVFARNVKECFKLQLLDQNRYTPAMATLLNNFELLKEGEYRLLAKRCNVETSALEIMIRALQSLSTCPAHNFQNEVTQSIIPDVWVIPTKKGFHIELNTEALPKILVNRRYYSEIKSQMKDEESKRFATENYTAASGFVRALEQRANTILKVATEIVKYENEFFTKGVLALQPLTLAKIAEAVEMHESTISRVVNGKFMSTPQGLVEFKYFFTSSISTQDGISTLSSTSVKHRIKTLIENEEDRSPLSDDALVTLLKEHKIEVARRTVTKYRESLGIASSFERKRSKTLRHRMAG